MKHRNGFRHELPGAAAAPGLAPIVRDPAPLLERLVEQVRERRAQGQPPLRQPSRIQRTIR